MPVLLMLAGCSQQDMVNKLASPQEQALAIEVTQALGKGHAETLSAQSEDNLRPQLAAYGARVKPFLDPIHAPLRVQTVNAVSFSDGTATKTLILSGGAGEHWALVTVVLRGTPGRLRLAGLNVLPLKQDPTQANAFSPGARGALGWFWLVMMGASVLSCLGAVGLIWRRHWLERRWLWTLGCLVGLGRFTLNWTTGQWSIQPIYVSLLGAQGVRAGYFAPWALSFGLPMFAWVVIVRWLQRER